MSAQSASSDISNPDLSITQLLSAATTDVTIFTLSWCAYCHAVKRLMQQLKLEFTEYELDTGIYRQPELNRQLRSELQVLTGSGTLPQVFVRGTNVGGYTDTAAAVQSGQFQKLISN